jgi:hypothetical protein
VSDQVGNEKILIPHPHSVEISHFSITIKYLTLVFLRIVFHYFNQNTGLLMKTTHAMKTALVSTLLTASEFLGATDAQEKETGPDGLYKDPICSFDFSIKRGLYKFLGEEPTGIKAASEQYQMEVYADPKDKSWTLVGKSINPAAPSGELCMLIRGIGKPYDQEIWYHK